MTLAQRPGHLMSLEEWDALPPDGAHRYELAEGILIVAPRPALRHQRVTSRLSVWLDEQLPDHLTALSEVEVVVKSGALVTVRVPDAVITWASGVEQNLTRVEASDVLVALEVISPSTKRADRVEKPAEYADAGIAHYWLVDLDDPASITAYTLVDGEYEIVAESSEVITVLEPAPLTIDVRKLTSRR
jgi:Uma2 family endonuclease